MRNDARQPAAWVSISEYARNYGLSRSMIYTLIENGKLENYRIDNVVRVRNVRPDQHRERSDPDGPDRETGA